MTRSPVEPYLFFNGCCEEAVEFYKKAPQPVPAGMLPKGFENKVMHATLKIGGSTVMVSDGNTMGANFSGFSLSLGFPTPDEADRAVAALADGGKVKMPMGKTFWSSRFGMLDDRFGVGWMISVGIPREK
ncbi:MAG: VOC family protein [Elusimicrobia bacterium]|nr:VOC family protein [Elusimicrobiota bacterium]